MLAQESPRVWPGTVGKDAKDIKKNNKLDGAKIEKVYVDTNHGMWVALGQCSLIAHSLFLLLLLLLLLLFFFFCLSLCCRVVG